MGTAQLAKRLVSLEAEVARLKGQMAAQTADPRPWWERISGRFAGDPIYDQAMRLGRKYRESLRPKSRKRRGADGGA
jgi:hypothetical protein